MRIRFLQHWEGYSPGDVADVELSVARLLINSGIAERDTVEADFNFH